MALLDENEIQKRAEERMNARLIAVTTKFSTPEVLAIEEAAKRGGVSRGEFVRDVVLREIQRSGAASTAPPELTEIVGLRLLLTTLLKPLAVGQRMTEETFEAVVAEVRRAKGPMAAELLTPQGGR